MSKIKGQNFRIFVDQGSGLAAVPEATNASISITGNTESETTKDVEGNYEQPSVVSTTWQCSVDTYQSTVAQLKAIITMFNAAQPVSVGWDQTTGATGTMNRTASEADFARSGQALLTDVTFTFNDRQTISTTLQFQGTGSLASGFPD